MNLAVTAELWTGSHVNKRNHVTSHVSRCPFTPTVHDQTARRI